VSPIHADELPPEVRKHLGLTAGKGRTRPAPSRAGIGHAHLCPGHCGCGQPFASYSDFEKHAKRAGCRTWRIDLPIPAPQETQ
jgi:hypothetical protein